MPASEIESLPDLENFLSLPNERITGFTDEFGINTIYLPVDGTRRYFISKSRLDQSNSNFFENYFDTVIPQTISLLKMCYDHGMRHVVLLLMDNSAFSRGKEYVSNAIKLGIEPTTNHDLFLDLYHQYEIGVYYGGFNDKYNSYQSLLRKIENITELTRNHENRTLTYYTGASSEMDYVELIHRHSVDNKDNIEEQDMNSVYNHLKLMIYGHNIPKIDLAFYYGYPRDKIRPPLLWGKSINYYTNNPSLALTRKQLRKGIYYAIKNKYSIKDDYKRYTLNSEEMKAVKLETENLIGETAYDNVNSFH